LGFRVQADGTKSTNFDFDPNLGLVHTVTHGVAATAEYGFLTFKNTTEIGVEVTLLMTNFEQGTVTWGAEVLWPGGVEPTWTVAGVDIAKFLSIDGGTTWHGWVVSLASA
jgi:hypothetical protein